MHQFYPSISTPRLVAGEPLENDVLKCRIKALDPRDYKLTFTVAEGAELSAIFPQGVCDFSERGVGQEPTDGTWQFF